MSTVVRLLILWVLLIGVPARGGARAQQVQPVSPHATDPQASSTDHGVARAAGMPLRDGSLPPGMLTVRVVNGSFSNNVTDVAVSVTVAGGKIERATTGADGRAQFAHLPVGGTVQATAVTGVGALVSDPFDMPAESGVRLLLVIGDGPVTATGVPPGTLTVVPRLEPGGTPPFAPGLPSVESSSSVSPNIIVIRVVLAMSCVFGAVLLGLRRARRI